MLKRLAQATGGEAFFPGAVSSVVTACERIARDIRHQYTIGYVSTNPARHRRLSGHSGGGAGGGQAGKLVVRTRSGYIARGDPTEGQVAK